MIITIHLKTSNAAFEDDADAEIVRILSRIVDRWSLYGPPDRAMLTDFNGNIVGDVRVEIESA